MMLLFCTLVVLTLLFSSVVASENDRNGNKDLLPCTGNDRNEYAFYHLDISFRQLECDQFQLTTLGFLVQDIVDDIELMMPEYKGEYMRAVLCPLADVEEDDGGRRLAGTTRYTFRSRGSCRRCRNRTRARHLSSRNTVCDEVEHAFWNKEHTEQSCEAAYEALVTVTELAWAYGNDSRSIVQMGDEVVHKCELANRLAGTAVRVALPLCEEAIASDGSASRVRRIMRKAQEASKVTKEAALKAAEAFRQVEKAQYMIEKKVETDGTTMSRRELDSDSSFEDATVGDVCSQVDVARAEQSRAEKALSDAERIVQEMRDMSKDYARNEDVQDIIEDAEKYRDDVEKEKDKTIKAVEEVEEQCDKAKEKPKDASKYMKDALKKTEDVTKTLLKVHSELSKLKAAEDKMDQLADRLGFSPVISKLEETVQEDEDEIEKQIKKVEEEIAKIDEELPASVKTSSPTSTETVGTRTTAGPVTSGTTSTILQTTKSAATSTVDMLKQKELEMKKAALLREEKQLRQISLENQRFISRQSSAQKSLYQQSIARQYEQDGPLQILLASCSGQTKSAINWNPHTQTSTLSEWFEKFGNLLIHELPDRLPRVFNSTSNGCINDRQFCVIVNITEAEGAFDDLDPGDCLDNAVDMFKT